MAEKQSPPPPPEVPEAKSTRPSKPFDGAMDGAISRSDSIDKSISGGADVIWTPRHGHPTPLTVNSAAPPPPPPQQGKSKK
jgi:hypothetical protein